MTEDIKDVKGNEYAFGKGYCTFISLEKDFKPSLKPKFTPRNNVHKVVSHKDTWALTFRGPWEDTWFEVTPRNERITLTHGRIRV